jgi:hypothetical protein
MWRTWFDKRLDNFPGLRGGVVLAQLLLLNVVSISAVYDRLGWAGDVVATARFGGLNRGEMALLERGYYEDLLTVDRFNGELAALYAKQPKGWEISLEEAGLTQPAVGLPYQLRPNAKAVFKGSVLRTNEWGMHDQDYALQKRTGCYRIALLGASHVMGTGVERDETFDSILEQRLNPESGTKPDLRIEILNFAVYGYYPADQLRVLEDKVLAFEPDAVLYVGHPGDVNRVAHDLALSVQEGTALADQFLSDVARQAGVTRKTPLRLARRQLQSYGEVILSQVYRKLAGKCTENGIHAMFVLLPMVPESAVQDEQTREAALARDAGFTIFDLDNVYDRHDRHSLWIAEWDAHPNSRGHRLIADRLYELIMEHEELFFSELQPQLVD